VAKQPRRQAPSHAPALVVDFQINMPRQARRALEAALADAVAGDRSIRRIRVSTKLVYVTPRTGVPAIKLTLISAEGETSLALLDPDNLTPESIAVAVSKAERGPQ
jgi:hypothetical protein